MIIGSKVFDGGKISRRCDKQGQKSKGTLQNIARLAGAPNGMLKSYDLLVKRLA